MSDKIIIQDGKAVVITDEGRRITRPESEVVEMIAAEVRPPLDRKSFPDGIKFVRWRPPGLVLVHQRAPQVAHVRWIAEDSPSPFGPGTKYRRLALSMPYAITFALFFYRHGRLFLSSANELYFRNEPLLSEDDRLGFPAILNISKVDVGKRSRAWICTQYLKVDGRKQSVTEQLESLINHCTFGAMNFSSEHHEGASWYTESSGIHPDLHPVEKWAAATKTDQTFALKVPWIKAKHSVGQLMDCLLDEQLNSSMPSDGGEIGEGGGALPLASRFLNFAQGRK